MWIENERRPGKTPGRSRTVAVHADHVKGLAGKAEREMRIVRTIANFRVPLEENRVQPVQIYSVDIPVPEPLTPDPQPAQG